MKPLPSFSFLPVVLRAVGRRRECEGSGRPPRAACSYPPVLEGACGERLMPGYSFYHQDGKRVPSISCGSGSEDAFLSWRWGAGRTAFSGLSINTLAALRALEE